MRAAFNLVVSLMIAATVIAILMLVPGCDQQDYVTQPPEAYRHDAMVMTWYVTDTDAACRSLGARTERVGAMIVGCYSPSRHLMVRPNDCTWPDKSDIRDVGCHEIGHANGAVESQYR